MKMAAPVLVLGVTGSIAAYKAAELCSRFVKEGFEVYVVMTAHAAQFVSPLTFETLSGHPVAQDLFERSAPHEIEHISLARRADVFLIAPASANILGKYANGIADDLLSTTLLATKAPVVIAPAMNTQMYQSEAVQHNIALLRSRGVWFVSPASGRLACGEEGEGRLAELGDIVSDVKARLHKQDLAGKSVLVSAGPTREAIDPVRYITNRSTGFMGYSIADAAAMRGARVTLVSGPSDLDAPHGVMVEQVTSTQDMLDVMQEHLSGSDIVVMAAAPADFTPVDYAAHKIKKSEEGDTLALHLRRTPDILKTLSTGPRRFLVGFAAETRDVLAYAKDKLRQKGLDMIIANDITEEGAGFGKDTNIVTVITENGEERLPQMPKTELAHEIWDRILRLYSEK